MRRSARLSFDIVPTVTLTGGLRAYRYDNSLIGFFGFGRNPARHRPFNAAGSSRTGVAGCYTTTGAEPARQSGRHPAARRRAGLALHRSRHVQQRPARAQVDHRRRHHLPRQRHLAHDARPYGLRDLVEGFRPGGINRRGTSPPYQKDTLTNYEIGFHTQWGRAV